MKPDVWGRALDEIAVPAPGSEAMPTLIVPTPAGQSFTQATADRVGRGGRTWSSPAAGTRASTSG